MNKKHFSVEVLYIVLHYIFILMPRLRFVDSKA